MNMDNDAPGREIIETAMALACQAPSLHNSQPWRWVVDGRRIALYTNADRMLPSTDAFGRQMIISCGAALHHAQVAFGALGWSTEIDRLPDTDDPHHLATLDVTGRREPTEHDVARTVAIPRRRSDRLPFEEPPDTAFIESELRDAVTSFDVVLTRIASSDLPELARASRQTASARRYDSMYQTELRWWTGHSPMPDGVPREALPSVVENVRVPAGRRFPSTDRASRRVEVPQDRSAVLVLATGHDSLPAWLRCGEALSEVLLACTAHGLGTCPLTHLTELPQSRAIITGLMAPGQLPQVLVRVGIAPGVNAGTTTQRLALADVLRFVEDSR